MEEKIDSKSVETDQKKDVLLVHDKESNKVDAVKGIDDKGNLQTVSPKQNHNNDFLKLDRSGDIATNFLKNFVSQVKDPTRFEFFKANDDNVEESAKVIQNHIKNPSKASEKKVDKMRVDIPPTIKQEEKLNKSTSEAQYDSGKYFISPNKIDWESLKSFGLSKDQIEKSESFELMLKGYKSHKTFPIEAKMGNVNIKTDARISFRPDKNGDVILAIHGMRSHPDLNRPFFGHHFSKEDKENLVNTGNMGRVVDIKNYYTGQTHPSFISIDKLTNELVSMRADKLFDYKTILGVTLNQEQKRELKEGKPVWVENMNSSNNKPYSAFIQVNADIRGIQFLFNNNQKQSRNQNITESKGSGVRIPKTLAGVELSEKQQNDLKSDKTIYVKGLKDKAGQEYNAYIKVNTQDNKLDFYKFNPDKAKDKAKEVTPSNEHKTQVSVNSEGKTNEATKNVNEPLKQGQDKPTEPQIKKQEKEESKPIKQGNNPKKKGIKM